MNAIIISSGYTVPAGKVLIITGYPSASYVDYWTIGSTLPAGTQIHTTCCGILKNATT